jgi:hypothetical protein
VRSHRARVEIYASGVCCGQVVVGNSRGWRRCEAVRYAQRADLPAVAFMNQKHGGRLAPKAAASRVDGEKGMARLPLASPILRMSYSDGG